MLTKLRVEDSGEGVPAVGVSLGSSGTELSPETQTLITGMASTGDWELEPGDQMQC